MSLPSNLEIQNTRLFSMFFHEYACLSPASEVLLLVFIEQPMQLSMHSDSFRSGGGREGEITARHTAYEWKCFQN